MSNQWETRVYESSYRGWKSAVIENGNVRAELVPELGGKLVSLRDCRSGKEWLLDAGDRELRRPDYGSPFTEWDMSGWDECFPTIDACRVAGIDLPDHGELWPLPWSCRLETESIVTAANAVRMPLRLTRSRSRLRTGCGWPIGRTI